jgi:hypothetical protein
VSAKGCACPRFLVIPREPRAGAQRGRTVDFPGWTNTPGHINPQANIVGRSTGADRIGHGLLWRGFVKG